MEKDSRYSHPGRTKEKQAEVSVYMNHGGTLPKGGSESGIDYLKYHLRDDGLLHGKRIA